MARARSPKPSKIRSPWRRRFALAFKLGLAVGVLAIGALLIAVYVAKGQLPSFDELKSSPNGQMIRVRAATRSSGHLRILLGTGGQVSGLVHVRDTLTAPDEAPAGPFARPVFTLDADTTVHAALTSMRETRNHLAVVTDLQVVAG